MEGVIPDGNGWERLRTGINGDPEFRIIGRYMTVNLVMQIGADKRLFRIREGLLDKIVPVLPMVDPVDICVKGSESFWEKLLSPVPPPGFQNLKAGMRAANCEIYGNSELYAAYFPAITRIIGVMRENSTRAID
jgi:hypothetical protein